MSKTQYLQKLGHSWYVRVKVPAALQAKIGNTHIRRALGTRDLDEAVRRKWGALALIQSHLAALAGHDASPGSLPALLATRAPSALPSPFLGGSSALPEIAIDCNFAYPPNVQLIANNQPEPRLDFLLDKWLDGSAHLKTTKFQRRQAYGELRAFLGADVFPVQVTEALAAEYVDERLRPNPDCTSTKRRKLSALAAFWEWMGSRKMIPRNFNPWRGFRLGAKGVERKSGKKRAYTMPELAHLFSGSPKYPALREVMVLALYTGARIDEICSLSRGAIRWERGTAFVRIVKSKTPAGTRTLAVSHPIAISVLRSRCAEPTIDSSQLFPELRGGGYDKKLSWGTGQAFRYYRDSIGLTGETDFHSLRRTFITRMENLGVDQVRIARYVGHQLPTLAFTVYSGGSTENTQKITGRAISYPSVVEKAVMKFLVE